MAARAMQTDLTGMLLRLGLSEASRETKFPGVASVVRQCRCSRARGLETHEDALEETACSEAGGLPHDIAVATPAGDPCLLDDARGDVEDIS